MSSLESLCEDIRTNVTVWKRYRDKGGSDPSWSDGDNMNLCRNHIIDDRRRIEETIARDGIEPPAVSKRKPEYDENQPDLFA